LSLALSATGGLPELVVLPPLPEGSVDEQSAIEAWSAITSELKRQKGALGVSLELQIEAHDALVGPGKEQAWECKGKRRCLTDLGGTFGADLLVTGSITNKRVILVLFDVARGRKLTGAKSSRRLSKRSPTRRGKAAARGLAKAYERLLAKKAKPANLADAKEAGRRRRAGQAVKKPSKKKKSAKKRSTKKKKKKAAKAKAKAKKADEAPPPEPDPADEFFVDLDPTDDPKPAADSAKEPVAEPSKFAIDGVITIAADQLIDVTRVTVDGTAVAPKSDGTLEWMGAPGAHQVIATRTDGARASQEIVVEPRSRVPVLLTFSAPAPVFQQSFEDPPEDKTVFEEWWFWVGVGAALVAGGVTGAALVGGGKGGPSLDGDGFGDSLNGSISGTY